MDELANALARKHDPITAGTLVERYRTVLSAGYQDAYAPVEAVEDIRIIEGLSSARPLSVNFHRAAEGPGISLKVWSYQRPIPLSERVPVLENMGFRVVDEQTYSVPIEKDAGSGAWLHDIALETADNAALDIDAQKPRLEACFLMVMRGAAENDGYNALVLKAGLMWRDVALIRAVSRFLRQIRVPFSQDYMWTTLRKHAPIAANIVALFLARFDPRIESEKRPVREIEIHAAIEEALQSVASLDEDRIIRHFVSAVRAAARTNFFRLDTDGQPKPVIAIKFASRNIDACPRPRPLYEIFVYSPRVEGVHLRFGKVARGGIRWSDRPQDFRTEILGLVKAQQVKNAVIVPVGAKGGFVPKQAPIGGPREAMQAEGIATYKIFISTLLDITDNLGLHVMSAHRRGTPRSGDNPYLVVAADKGTATFSDTANAISDAHGFWPRRRLRLRRLGRLRPQEDGNHGARRLGGGETQLPRDRCRHHRGPVLGCGDRRHVRATSLATGCCASGRSRLVAAFDHRDIFLDPNPDPEKTLSERRRLFDLPRSSWQDFDKALISNGGGVFSRSAKEIKLRRRHSSSSACRRRPPVPRKSSAPFCAPRSTSSGSAESAPISGRRAKWMMRSGTAPTIRSASPPPNCAARSSAKAPISASPSVGGSSRDARHQAQHRRNRQLGRRQHLDIEVNIKIALSLPMREGELTVKTATRSCRT